jgi:hypothetical protein
MSRIKRFPKTITVTGRRYTGERVALDVVDIESQRGRENLEHGDVVAVYVLKESKTVSKNITLE